MGTFRQLLWWGQLAGIYLFAFFSPFSIAGSQIGLALALGCWLLDFTFEFPRPFPVSFLILPVLFYAVATFLAAIFGINFKTSAQGFIELWLFLPLFFFPRRLADANLRRKVFDFLAASAGVIALYAILQHFTGWHPYSLRPLDPIGNRFRSIGTFSTPLTFGLYFALITTAFLSLGWQGRRTLRGKLYLLVSALSFWSALFNMGRAAQLSVFVGIFFVILFLKGKERLWVAGATAVLTLFAFLSSPEIFTRFHQFENYEFEKNAENRRMAVWERSYQIFQDHPIFGIGFGNFGSEYEKQVKGSWAKIVGHAHNDFLNVLVHAGLVGFSAFLFFWKVLIGQIWRGLRTKQDESSRKFWIMGLACFLVYLVYAQFESSFFDQEIQMLLFFLFSAPLSFFVRKTT